MWSPLGLLLLAVAVSAQNRGFYTVVAPKTLRPNWEYHAAVSTQGVSEPTTVVVEVGGKQDSGGIFSQSQFITVEPYNTRILKLEIGDIGPGRYNLSVRGDGGLNFRNTTELKYEHKSYSVFIQTDKAIYKPGHNVKFRVLVLSAQLRPTVTAALDIHVTDGEGNRVRQWTRVLATKGVFSGEFELSKNPVMGDWVITVNVLDQKFTKKFQVAEYVLPKFHVTIDVPAHATFKQSTVVAVIRSKYTYGRPVKGEATITAYPSYFSDVIQPIFQNPIRKVIKIDGKATAEFDIVKELRLTDDYERVVQFDVTVEEELTGRRQNITAQTIMHKHKYKLDLIKTSEYFKPGLKYTAFVKLSHHDGTPVIDKTNPVKVRHGYSYNNEEYQETEHKLSQNGLVELTFYPPSSNVSTLGIEAEYLGIKEWFSTVSAAVSPSNSFIQATVVTDKPMVNQDVEILVNSTEPLRYLSYQVLGRGDVINAGTVTANGRTASWRFLATYGMAPTAHIIVQYIRSDGEVVADALDIELDGVLQNFVKVNPSTEETEPGSNVELRLEAKPNSYIGLLGVDQSVLLLKTGNDIGQEDVLEELRSYDKSDSNTFLPFMRGVRDKRSLSWWPGSFTAHEAFDKSGAVIMTNGYVHEHMPWLYFRANFNGDDLAYAADLSPESTSSKTLGGEEVSVRVRSKFPETWIWEMLDAGFDGRTSIRKTVPDTITSWVISAFSVDPLYGLGLIDAPRKVKVFRPFFVSLDLPYSVIRGETISIPVVVFNYLDKAVSADVTLENAGQFDFADYSNDVYDTPKLELYRRKRVQIEPNSGASTSFMITPKELGHITIKVSAKSVLAGDAVERTLLVKAEGETQYKNKAIFIDLRNKNSYKTNFTLDIPVNIVPGSEIIEVAAIGDILGSSITNLDRLIKMPFGCGEQNMLNFVPNIVVLDYLKNSNQLIDAIQSRAMRYLETGYQQELTYRHSDGSFSAFGKADKSGSTWLTAFVAKSFRQAVKYIPIEENIIDEALQWLSTTQAANGSFPEVGQVSHKDMQGGSGKGLPLTAFTLLAFLESRSVTNSYTNVMNKAVDYIVRSLDGLEDPYSIAICSYVLHLYRHPSKELAFSLLEAKAHSTSDMKWWKRVERETDKKNPHAQSPNSVDVEMTAYSLLTYMSRGLVEDSVPIMKWLLSQQNQEGGFASTQDTVVAIGALARLAEVMTARTTDVAVTFTYGKGVTTQLRVNSGNTMVLQKEQISKKVRQLDVSAQGQGFAVVQVSYRYNVNVTGAWPMFTLDPQVDKNSDSNHLQLSICSGFIGSAESNESNMAVMEVVLPSGFTADLDALPSLQLSQNVKRVETEDGDTKVVLYFDKMVRQEYCPTVSAFRTHKVAKQRPVPVTIYDYYDQSRRARMFYEPRVATLCEICEGEDCRICSGKPGSQSSKPQKDSASLPQLSLLLLLAPVIILHSICQ